jgi:outer membrane PBP1 activator LpoA protein
MPASSNCSNRRLRQDAGKAALLRLSAADLAYHQGNAGQSAQILQQVPLEQLKPASRSSPAPWPRNWP